MGTSIEDLNTFYKPKTDEWLSQGDLFIPSPQNIVSTVKLGCIVPLNRVMSTLGVPSLRRSKLSVATIRFVGPRSKYLTVANRNIQRVPTIQLFERGQAVIVGATSEEISILYCHILRIFLLNIGIQARCNKLVIWNIVCSGFFPYGINTINFEKENNKVTTVKDKGEFPGVMFVIGKFKITLFPTGKFIVMGMGSREDRKDFLPIIPIFYKYKLNETTIVSKAQLGTEMLNMIVRKRQITDISNVDKAVLLDIAREAINAVDFGLAL